MKPIDARNETWDQLRARLTGLRQETYDAYVRFGPGTTREVSTRSGISILTLRPRTTELVQLGFVEAIAPDETGREAIYGAVPVDLVKSRFEWQKRQPSQAEFPF